MVFRAYREAFPNAIALASRGERKACGLAERFFCGTLPAMRRAQSVFVLVAMLAIPLALLARSGPCAQSKCSRMCALILGSVRAQHLRCTCGMTADGAQCPMNSSQQVPDYGLNAPIAPTMPSARVAIAPPNFARHAFVRDAEFTPSGFRFELLQPPRA
jgi:hypothetical protein